MHTSEPAEQSARRMRRELTYAEKQLWKVLRGLEGRHFRRQAPMGPYVVDFIEHAHRLVIEVDGGVHRLEAVALRASQREDWLKERDYRVVRLTNAQALSLANSGDRALLAAIGADTPTPNPSPQGGGEL